MWITSASSSPSIDADLAHAPPSDPAAGEGLQTTAQAAQAALLRLNRLGDVSEVIRSCFSHLRGTRNHLSPPTLNAAFEMLCELAEHGNVVVQPGDTLRMAAAQAVLWVMEEYMPGTELIMGPDRPSPLRTIGDPDATAEDQARAKILLGRLRRNSALHLVFCRDGEADIRRNAMNRLPLGRAPVRQQLQVPPAPRVPSEHVLPLPRSTFPPHRSGVLIMDSQWTQAAFFAMHSMPAHPNGTSRALVLRWAQGQSPSQAPAGPPSSNGRPPRMVASDVADPAFKLVLQDWADFLNSIGAQGVTAEMVRD